MTMPRLVWDEGPQLFHRSPCDRDPEFCGRCGRQLVLTVEKARRARDTGEQLYQRWHSCPHYLVPSWQVMFMGRGYGHDSHDADEPLMAREWR